MANTQVYWLHTLSPTHVGTGRGVGYIDLPIHRDKVTNWPLIPGSAFKGVWADHHRATREARDVDSKLGLVFGRASDNPNASNAGALIPTDARLVCLPIRSFFGTFAWCTSPLALQMLQRDLELAGMKDVPPVPPTLAPGVVHSAKDSRLADNKKKIYLEDLDFDGKECDTATKWAAKIAGWVFPGDENKSWRERFMERFAVVPDEIFDFLTETGTEVTTRVHISDETKTVEKGHLWNEESLPTETILVGLIQCDRVYSRGVTSDSAESLIATFATEPLQLQIGGKATVGRGRVRCVFTAGGRV